MKSFCDYIKSEMNLEMPTGTVSGAWFAQNGLPMIVSCCCCDMTMASPSAWVDDQGYIYCADCADAE